MELITIGDAGIEVARKFQSFTQRAPSGRGIAGQLEDPFTEGMGFAAQPSGLVAVE
jgi:hypothetical protein